ncbi:unnamed protein product [Caenorhabditis sp. 36 PRJEB53466]|nr:unnamed protein product [Caenorhabditis sp. 36 PRJEB53466]
MTTVSEGSFYLRETGEIREVYEVLLLSECPFHVLNILMLLVSPFFIFSSKTLANINLKIIILSYTLAGLLMSISRLSWLVCDLFWVPIDTMEVFMYSRFVFQTSISAHLFVFSAERAIATWRSKRYEQNSCFPAIILCCALTYPYALFQLYSKYCFTKGREINVLMIVAFSVFSLLTTTVVLVTNKKKAKHRRWKGPISEAYQVRENIRTSRLLLQVFAIGVFFVGLGCFFLLRFSASLTDPSKNWSTITNGFVYDMLVAVGTSCTTSVFLQFLIPDQLQKKLFPSIRAACNQQIVTPATKKRTKFRSIHGGDVEIGAGTAEEEARVYFSQLSIAWKK